MTKLKNQNFDNSKTQIVTKPKRSSYDKTQKLNFLQNKKTKLFLFGTYGIVIGITYWIFDSGRSIIYDDIIRYDFNAFLDGFTGWGNSMQFDPFVLLFILPLTIALFFKSKNGIIFFV